jgi:hypothetical protein
MKLRFATATACIAAFGLLQACPSVSQSGHVSDNNPEVVAIRQYRLTMDKIDKLVAAMGAVNKLVASDPGLRKRLEGGSDNDQSIDQKVRSFDTSFPQLTAVVHSNGLTTREYVMVSLAFLNDVMVVGMKKQGLVKEYPANTITPENAAFVEQNYDKLRQISEKLTPQNGDQ